MRIPKTNRKTRKLSSINEDQLETLGSVLELLKSLSVVGDYHIISKRYYDTITSYRSSSPGLSVDSSWCSLYEVEKIVLGGKELGS